jgi:hypothetical protein
VSDSFQFTEEFVGETFEEVVDASQGESPIDLDHPGFASLLTLLKAIRAGTAARWMLEIYAHQLGKQVFDSRSRLAAMPIPEMIREQATMAINAMTYAMDEFQQVLDYVGMYLETEDSEALDGAQVKLEMIHAELPGFISQLQAYSQVEQPAVAPASPPLESEPEVEDTYD